MVFWEDFSPPGTLPFPRRASSINGAVVCFSLCDLIVMQTVPCCSRPLVVLPMTCRAHGSRRICSAHLTISAPWGAWTAWTTPPSPTPLDAFQPPSPVAASTTWAATTSGTRLTAHFPLAPAHRTSPCPRSMAPPREHPLQSRLLGGLQGRRRPAGPGPQ